MFLHSLGGYPNGHANAYIRRLTNMLGACLVYGTGPLRSKGYSVSLKSESTPLQ